MTKANLSAWRYYAPNAEAEVLIVVIGTWAHIRAVQVQSVRLAVIARSRRPIVAATPPIAGGRRTEVAGVEEVIREGS